MSGVCFSTVHELIFTIGTCNSARGAIHRNVVETILRDALAVLRDALAVLRDALAVLRDALAVLRIGPAIHMGTLYRSKRNVPTVPTFETLLRHRLNRLRNNGWGHILKGRFIVGRATVARWKS